MSTNPWWQTTAATSTLIVTFFVDLTLLSLLLIFVWMTKSVFRNFPRTRQLFLYDRKLFDFRRKIPRLTSTWNLQGLPVYGLSTGSGCTTCRNYGDRPGENFSYRIMPAWSFGNCSTRFSVQCCFTPTETIRLIMDGESRSGCLDFHTAPELWETSRSTAERLPDLPWGCPGKASPIIP